MPSSASAPTDVERDRKAEHLQLSLEGRMQGRRSYFDAYRFDHVALPDLALAEVDLGTTFLGKPLSAPLLISCMTGGTEAANAVNRNLAEAAEAAGIAVGVGSQRRALEAPEQAGSFRIRELAPTVPLLANLGAVQLNYGFGLDECEQAVAMIDADALVFHLNPLQEAIQPEGQTDFRGLVDKMAAVAERLSVPVVVKEIGCGLTEAVARRLAEAGLRILDTAGSGGTSWARIEAQRAEAPELGEVFAHWGVPTPESIRQVRRVPGVTVIGSGGLRTGLDVAKAVACGADLCGMAYPFLKAAVVSSEQVVSTIDRIVRELRIALFCAGARTLDDLRRTPLHPAP